MAFSENAPIHWLITNLLSILPEALAEVDNLKDNLEAAKSTGVSAVIEEIQNLLSAAEFKAERINTSLQWLGEIHAMCPDTFNQDRGWEVQFTGHKTFEADTREDAVRQAMQFEYLLSQNANFPIYPTSFHNCLDGHTHEVVGHCEISDKPIFEDDEFRVEGDVMYLVAESDPDNMQEVFAGLDEPDEPNGLSLDLLTVDEAKHILPERPDFNYQHRVYQWLVTCFSELIAYDRVERVHRFTEEALELAQASGCSREDACTILNSVFGKRPGQIAVETGQVMVTLAGLCVANELQMDAEGENELQRLWGKIEEKRAKHAAKVPGSPLAGVIDLPLRDNLQSAADLIKNDECFLPWLHELTVAGYECNVIIPTEHAEAVAAIYIHTKDITAALDAYKKFLVRWNTLNGKEANNG